MEYSCRQMSAVYNVWAERVNRLQKDRMGFCVVLLIYPTINLSLGSDRPLHSQAGFLTVVAGKYFKQLLTLSTTE